MVSELHNVPDNTHNLLIPEHGFRLFNGNPARVCACVCVCVLLIFILLSVGQCMSSINVQEKTWADLFSEFLAV